MPEKITFLTENQVLKFANFLLSGDSGSDYETVKLKAHQGEKVTPLELEFAELLSTLFQLIHPYGSECANDHPDWKARSALEFQEHEKEIV